MKIRRLSKATPRSYTVGKVYEVTHENSVHWFVKDDRCRGRCVNKNTDKWEEVPSFEDVVKPEMGYAYRIGDTKDLVSWTQFKYYPIIQKDAKGDAEIKADNGQDYSISFKGKLWEFRLTDTDTNEKEEEEETVFIRRTAPTATMSTDIRYRVVEENGDYWRIKNDRNVKVWIPKDSTWWKVSVKGETTSAAKDPEYITRVTSGSLQCLQGAVFEIIGYGINSVAFMDSRGIKCSRGIHTIGPGRPFEYCDSTGVVRKPKGKEEELEVLGDPAYFTAKSSFPEEEHSVTLHDIGERGTTSVDDLARMVEVMDRHALAWMDKEAINAINLISESKVELTMLEINIENNVTMVNNKRADSMSVDDFLHLIATKQTEIDTMMNTRLGEGASSVITGRIQVAKQVISDLVKEMDAQHDTKDAS